jgi:hypothetical protein
MTYLSSRFITPTTFFALSLVHCVRIIVLVLVCYRGLYFSSMTRHRYVLDDLYCMLGPLRERSYLDPLPKSWQLCPSDLERAARVRGVPPSKVTRLIMFIVPFFNLRQRNLDKSVRLRSIISNISELGSDGIFAPFREQVHPEHVVNTTDKETKEVEVST